MTEHDASILIGLGLLALAVLAYAFTATVRYIARRTARTEILAFLKAGMLPPRDRQGRFKRSR